MTDPLDAIRARYQPGGPTNQRYQPPGDVMFTDAITLLAEIDRLRADVEALLPPARLYLQCLDAEPENEWLTLPEAMLVTAVREAVARHTDPTEG